MAVSLIVLLSLTMGGVGGDVVGSGPLSGVVVGPDGRPSPGALVVAAGGAWDGDPPAVMGRATADGEGRFILELADALTACDRPTLWAFGPGLVAGSSMIDRDALEGRPTR